MTRVTGLDLSLTSTGWATATVAHPGTALHVEVGRIRTKAPDKDHAKDLNLRSTRLRSITTRVWNYCAAADLVLIESPAFSSGSGHAHDRSGLWWLVVARLTGAGIPVVEVGIQTLKMFATGKGSADKDSVLLAAARTFPHVEVTGNDEADSLWACALGARLLGHPIDPWPQVPQDRARALTKLLEDPTMRALADRAGTTRVPAPTTERTHDRA